MVDSPDDCGEKTVRTKRLSTSRSVNDTLRLLHEANYILVLAYYMGCPDIYEGFDRERGQRSAFT